MRASGTKRSLSSGAKAPVTGWKLSPATGGQLHRGCWCYAWRCPAGNPLRPRGARPGLSCLALTGSLGSCHSAQPRTAPPRAITRAGWTPAAAPARVTGVGVDDHLRERALPAARVYAHAQGHTRTHTPILAPTHQAQPWVKGQDASSRREPDA